MRCRWAARIETALFGTETDTRHTKRHDLALLAWRQTALDPDEACTTLETAIGCFPVEIRNDRRKKFDGFIRIDDLARLGKERRCFDICRKNFTVAIQNVGTRCELVYGRTVGIIVLTTNHAKID